VIYRQKQYNGATSLVELFFT